MPAPSKVAVILFAVAALLALVLAAGVSWLLQDEPCDSAGFGVHTGKWCAPVKKGGAP